jgi:hypothetical protein
MASATKSTALAIGVGNNLVIGHYRLRAQFGRGTPSSVWIAEHAGQLFALKLPIASKPFSGPESDFEL